LFPDHPPEVIPGGRQWALGYNILPLGGKTLSMREHEQVIKWLSFQSSVTYCKSGYIGRVNISRFFLSQKNDEWKL
jgi:hypothetical protein